jgi:acyl carrier protein
VSRRAVRGECLPKKEASLGDATAFLTREQAYVLLHDIVRDVLGCDAVALEDATRADDVPGWDSLAQIGVLAAAEIRFGVEIRAAEADRLRSFGDLVDLILQKRPHLP